MSSAQPAPALPPRAREAALLAAPSTALSVWRFTDDPAIYVALFPSLHAQAMALNRVAAFIERADAPHDHLLGDAQLRQTLGPSAEGFDSYYYGHDYREADLVRFFAAASRDSVRLSSEERGLQTALARTGFFANPEAALISLPAAGAGLLDAQGRRAILCHELSHGAFFTDARFYAYTSTFWRSLTEAERGAFRVYLHSQGYDPGDDLLMRNEAQAYLVFTDDLRLFDPAQLGLPEAATLRARFIAGIPLAWLRRDALIPCGPRPGGASLAAKFGAQANSR